MNWKEYLQEKTSKDIRNSIVKGLGLPITKAGGRGGKYEDFIYSYFKHGNQLSISFDGGTPKKIKDLISKIKKIGKTINIPVKKKTSQPTTPVTNVIVYNILRKGVTFWVIGE